MDRRRTSVLTTLAASLALALPAALAPSQDDARPDLQTNEHKSGTYDLDSSHTTALFRIAHFGVSWFYGTFEEVNGVLVVDEADPSKSSIDVTIPVASVRSRAADRDEHLKNDDFFDEPNHPTLSFKSTKVERIADDVFAVTGDLTMRGVTKSIDIEVERVASGLSLFGDWRTGFHTRFSVDRRDFDMGALPPPALGNEVQLTLSLEAVLRQ